jgi:hypothetical protein
MSKATHAEANPGLAHELPHLLSWLHLPQIMRNTYHHHDLEHNQQIYTTYHLLLSMFLNCKKEQV